MAAFPAPPHSDSSASACAHTAEPSADGPSPLTPPASARTAQLRMPDASEHANTVVVLSPVRRSRRVPLQAKLPAQAQPLPAEAPPPQAAFLPASVVAGPPPSPQAILHAILNEVTLREGPFGETLEGTRCTPFVKVPRTPPAMASGPVPSPLRIPDLLRRPEAAPAGAEKGGTDHPSIENAAHLGTVHYALSGTQVPPSITELVC